MELDARRRSDAHPFLKPEDARHSEEVPLERKSRRSTNNLDVIVSALDPVCSVADDRQPQLEPRCSPLDGTDQIGSVLDDPGTRSLNRKMRCDNLSRGVRGKNPHVDIVQKLQPGGAVPL